VREEAAGRSARSPRSLRKAWVALAGLSAVFLFEMLDNSILNVALPTIGRELHASTIALQWVTGAYAVVFGGLMLAFGAIADRFGRRRIMLIGLVLLGVASLATAFVFTAEQLVAVRVAMGVAAAMTTPGSMALATHRCPTFDIFSMATTSCSLGVSTTPPASASPTRFPSNRLTRSPVGGSAHPSKRSLFRSISTVQSTTRW
jgi:MFS family permease